MYRLLRPLLFRLDAERAHTLGVSAAHTGQHLPGLVERLFKASDPDGRLVQTLWTDPDRPGLTFLNPVGLAAGFDKNAALVRFWASLGFGFAEVGSVTAQPSGGNPRPRAFRLPQDGALINRMGLNNDGAEAVAARLAGLSRPDGFVLGINVAKTHSPAIMREAAIDDFRQSVRRLLPHADYLALNVSCPNTAEGKTFETPDALDALLAAVMDEYTAQDGTCPVLVKFSPPVSLTDFGGIDELVGIARGYGVDGFIATNTASNRDGLATDAARLDAIGNGGLSGRPLAERSTALVRHLYRLTEGALPIIGVGGVDSAAAAYRKIRAGASLVELYTALVYEGPGLVRGIRTGLLRLLDQDGFAHIAEAIGADA